MAPKKKVVVKGPLIDNGALAVKQKEKKVVVTGPVIDNEALAVKQKQKKRVVKGTVINPGSLADIQNKKKVVVKGTVIDPGALAVKQKNKGRLMVRRLATQLAFTPPKEPVFLKVYKRRQLFKEAQIACKRSDPAWIAIACFRNTDSISTVGAADSTGRIHFGATNQLIPDRQYRMALPTIRIEIPTNSIKNITSKGGPRTMGITKGVKTKDKIRGMVTRNESKLGLKKRYKKCTRTSERIITRSKEKFGDKDVPSEQFNLKKAKRRTETTRKTKTVFDLADKAMAKKTVTRKKKKIVTQTSEEKIIAMKDGVTQTCEEKIIAMKDRVSQTCKEKIIAMKDGVTQTCEEKIIAMKDGVMQTHEFNVSCEEIIVMNDRADDNEDVNDPDDVEDGNRDVNDPDDIEGCNRDVDVPDDVEGRNRDVDVPVDVEVKQTRQIRKIRILTTLPRNEYLGRNRDVDVPDDVEENISHDYPTLNSRKSNSLDFAEKDKLFSGMSSFASRKPSNRNKIPRPSVKWGRILKPKVSQIAIKPPKRTFKPIRIAIPGMDLLRNPCPFVRRYCCIIPPVTCLKITCPNRPMKSQEIVPKPIETKFNYKRLPWPTSAASFWCGRNINLEKSSSSGSGCTLALENGHSSEINEDLEYESIRSNVIVDEKFINVGRDAHSIEINLIESESILSSEEAAEMESVNVYFDVISMDGDTTEHENIGTSAEEENVQSVYLGDAFWRKGDPTKSENHGISKEKYLESNDSDSSTVEIC